MQSDPPTHLDVSFVDVRTTLSRNATESNIVLDQRFAFNFSIDVEAEADWDVLSEAVNIHFGEAMPGWNVVDAQVLRVF